MTQMLVSIIGIVVAGGLLFLYTQPAYDEIKRTQATIREYDQALDKAAELQQLKQSLLTRYNAFDPASLERLNKLLPDHVDNVRLVLDLDNLAARHQMALQNVVVSQPQSSSGGSSVIGAITTSKQRTDSLTLQFATRGTYENFIAFMRDLETSLRIVDLTSLKLSRETSQTGAEPIYRYDISMRTYWLK